MTSQSQPLAPDHNEPVGFADHNHEVCIHSVLAAVEALCENQGLRLTPVRRKVLELLLREHRALGAYAILDLLGEAGFGTQPPVAYRALNFLTEHGFVHKIERLNAFVACTHPNDNHAPAFMICQKCDAVAEVNAEPAKGALGLAAKALGFHVEKTVFEAVGVCPLCVEKAPK